MLEIRTHSYLNKASILHIDRRDAFKQKLLAKTTQTKEIPDKKTKYQFNEKF